jgi:hypothetical protein
LAQKGGDGLIKMGKAAQTIPIVGNILGALAIVGGLMLKGLGNMVMGIGWVVKQVIILSKYVAKAIIGATKRVVKATAQGGQKVFSRFFFVGAGDKKDDAKKKKKASQKEKQGK